MGSLCSSCPNVQNFDLAPIWGYLKEGFLTHLERHRQEVDGCEVYNGSLTNTYSGCSFTNLYHGTGISIGYGFGESGYTINQTWRNTCGDIGQCAPWATQDPATSAGEDYFALGSTNPPAIVGPWHTERIYINPVASQICHAFDGFMLGCTPMPKEFHNSPFVMLSGIDPQANQNDSGHTYSYDLAYIKVWQNPAWASIP